MASLADELAADYAEAIGDYEQSFLWNDGTYPCVRTTAAEDLRSLAGGDQEGISDRITVALSDLPQGQLPTQGDPIDGYALQIVKVDPNIGHLVLWCAPPMNMGSEE